MFGFKKKDGEPKKKEKMVFAKSKKEIVWLVIVWIIFLGNTTYVIFKYVRDQSPVQSSFSTQVPVQDPAAMR